MAYQSHDNEKKFKMRRFFSRDKDDGSSERTKVGGKYSLTSGGDGSELQPDPF